MFWKRNNNKAEQRQPLMAEAGKIITPLLSIHHPLADEKTYIRSLETVTIGEDFPNSKSIDHQYYIYFLRALTGIPFRSSLLKYTFIVLSPKEAAVKAQIVADRNKEQPQKADGPDGLGELCMLMFSKSFVDVMNRLQLQILPGLFPKDRKYRFEFMGPIVLTKDSDLAIPFVELNSLDSLIK